MGAQNTRVHHMAKRPRVDPDTPQPEPCPELKELVRLVRHQPSYVARCVGSGSPTLDDSSDLLDATLACDPIDLNLVQSVLASRNNQIRELRLVEANSDDELMIAMSAGDAAMRAVDIKRPDVLHALLTAGQEFGIIDMDSELFDPTVEDYVSLEHYIRRRTPLPWLAPRNSLPTRTAGEILRAFADGTYNLPPGLYDGVPAPRGASIGGDQHLRTVRLGKWYIDFTSAGQPKITGPRDDHSADVILLTRKLAAQSRGLDNRGIRISWPLTDDQREIQAQLAGAQQSVLAARGVLGPFNVTGVHLSTQWPSGGRIEMWVVCLGEEHVKLPEIEGYVKVRRVLQAAAQRARRRGACVDAFIEESWWRSSFRQGTWVRRDRAHPGETINIGDLSFSLNDTAWSLAGAVRAPHGVLNQQPLANPLGLYGARVHWFDSRAENSYVTQKVYRKGWHLIKDETIARNYALSILGWDAQARCIDPARPLHPPLLADLERIIGTAELNEWLKLHRLGLARMARRAQKIPPEDLEWLVEHLVATLMFEVDDWTLELSSIFACVADFYLLLRMFVPYPASRAGGLAGPPRHCLVYAGQWHTNHITNCLVSMGSHPGGSPPLVWQVEGVQPLDHIDVSVDEILTHMGLPSPRFGK